MAPELILVRGSDPDVKYLYGRQDRNAQGTHHYVFVARRTFDQWGDAHDEIQVAYHGGPLEGKTEWVPRPPSGEPPEPEEVDLLHNSGFIGHRLIVSYRLLPQPPDGIHHFFANSPLETIQCRFEGGESLDPSLNGLTSVGLGPPLRGKCHPLTLDRIAGEARHVFVFSHHSGSEHGYEYSGFLGYTSEDTSWD